MREPYSYRSCVHYSSSAVLCRAGIDPESLTDEDGRIPCVVIRQITGKRSCEHLQFLANPTVGEAGKMMHALEAIAAGKCPTCSGLIAGEMTFNESILALPCRHVIRSAK